MLATLTDSPAFDNPDWIFEIKWDGYRAIAELAGDGTRFYSRNGLSFNLAYKSVYNALKSIPGRAILDGEVVVYDNAGKPSFGAIQNYNSKQKNVIQYLVFDCLEYEGKDITKQPLVQRKEILRKMLPDSNVIKYCDHIESDGKALFEHAAKMGLEGIIAKRSSSLYYPGKRTREWLKIKNVNVDDFRIVGYTDPQGSRQYFGALLIATEDLVFRGEVGTGFSGKLLKELYEKLKPLEQGTSPLMEEVKRKSGWHWVEPVYSCQVQYTELTSDGHVRHPSFLGLRVDK